MDETLDFFGQWKEKHKDWEEAYAEIEPLLEEFKQSLSGDIEKWEHDAPTRTLHWTSANGLECSLSMLLGSKLKIWGMAWKDEEEKSERLLRKDTISQEISQPFKQDKLRRIFEEIIKELNELKENKLDSRVKLIPRP